MDDDIIMVPVPRSRLQDVYNLLAASPRRFREPTPDDQVATQGRGAEPPWDYINEALIRRAYQESPAAMKMVLEYLADHPEETVRSEELANAIGKTRSQLAGVLGAFGRRWANRYRQRSGPHPFAAGTASDYSYTWYKMSDRIARIVRELRPAGEQ